MGRPIICVNGKYYRSNEIDRERTLLYLINYLDGVASKVFFFFFPSKLKKKKWKKKKTINKFPGLCFFFF